ncbi:MAG TPA: HEAT repeat domain-containing protein [Pirellulales bacterium]|nr:HEAT repeat domain-containing protein [Pirellulales bacterium]
MSSFPSPPQDLSPDDALPPVEPPSAGFILQLFVVPGIIVVVVVTIWVMFNWLAQMGNDRDAFVRALSRNNEARWQAAFNLANALRAERGSTKSKLTGDPELAGKLAEILDREIESGGMDKNPITLRIYLCRALGEFKVADGLPTLIKAAMTERGKDEADVRRAALEGIAMLAANVGANDKSFSDNPQLSEALLKAAGDEVPRTRAAAAVAMGVVGGPQFVDRLHAMVDDSNPDVRYNAATRLAHLGDIAAVDVLVEMLDPDEQAGVELENEKDLRPFKRAVITINALRATAQLAEKNPDADLSTLARSIEKLLGGNVGGEIRLDATGVLRQLQARTAQSGQ